eukprot:2488891-Pyramimonas_sp.AAC.1
MRRRSSLSSSSGRGIVVVIFVVVIVVVVIELSFLIKVLIPPGARCAFQFKCSSEGVAPYFS